MKVSSIREANSLYESGDFVKALGAYLDICLRTRELAPFLRLNIERCCRRLEAESPQTLQPFHEHPCYFRYGDGHSKEESIVFFDNINQPRKRVFDGARGNEDSKNKIVFVADSNPASNPNRKVWGAETSAGFLAQYGRNSGHDVHQIDPLNFDEEAILSADLLVLRSIERLDDEKFKFIKIAIFEKLIPYVTYQHDYSFCLYRNSLKCDGVLSEGCRRCIEATSRFPNGQLSFYSELLRRASLNIFISHPQRHIFGEALGSVIDPSIVILPPVDPAVFKPVSVDRDPSLVVNTSGKLHSPNKGFSNIAKYIDSEKEKNYQLYTEVNEDIEDFASKRANVSVCAPVDITSLPEVYSRAGTLLVMPSVMEPAGRTPVEAALCGCKVVTNKNLGVDFFDLPLNEPGALKELILQSANSFWQKIDSVARSNG